jgi:hypothetical protein
MIKTSFALFFRNVSLCLGLLTLSCAELSAQHLIAEWDRCIEGLGNTGGMVGSRSNRAYFRVKVKNVSDEPILFLYESSSSDAIREDFEKYRKRHKANLDIDYIKTNGFTLDHRCPSPPFGWQAKYGSFATHYAMFNIMQQMPGMTDLFRNHYYERGAFILFEPGDSVWFEATFEFYRTIDLNMFEFIKEDLRSSTRQMILDYTVCPLYVEMITKANEHKGITFVDRLVVTPSKDAQVFFATEKPATSDGWWLYEPK